MTASRSPTSWSYNDKHNEANGEDNRDGHNDNRSWNCGVEGPTDDPAILDLRDRMRRNLMATMLLSQGTPMLLMGDEVGRTQDGNNNAYCQDNEIAWLEWKDINQRDRAFMEFVLGVIRLRKRYRLLRSGSFLHGEAIDDKGTRNVVWYRPDGQEMDDAAWTDPQAKVVGVLLCDATTRLMILVNPYHEPIDFKLPGANLAAALAASHRRRKRRHRPARPPLRRRAINPAGRAVAPAPGRRDRVTDRFHFRKSWGAEPAGEETRFRLWAPSERALSLRIAGASGNMPMRRTGRRLVRGGDGRDRAGGRLFLRARERDGGERSRGARPDCRA